MAIRLLSSESIDGTFKIGSGSLTNPSTNANDIVIDNGAGVETGMTFASSVASSIRFGQFVNNSIGSIEYIHTGNHLRFITNGAERVRITGVGNVGIGTGSDTLTRNLTVKGTTTSNINIKSNASNGYSILSLGDSDDDNYAQIILENSSNKLQIQNGGGGALGNRGITLDSSENVGIGTDSPANKLDVEGRIQGDNFVLGGSDSTVFYGMYRAGTETREVRLVSYEATPNSKVQLGMSNISGSSYTFAPALTVKANLRVGVGTIDPLNILHIKDEGVILRIEDTTQGLIGFIGDADACGLGTAGDFGIRTADDFTLMVGGSTPTLKMDSAGSIAMGNFSPSGTPAADYRSLEIGRQGNTITGAPWKSNLYLSTNATITAGSTAFTYRYLNELPTQMVMEDGIITFSNAVAPTTVGDTISFTERMKIAADGFGYFYNNFYLASASNQGNLFFGTADNQYNIFGGGTYGYMGYNTGGYHRFLVNGSNRLQLEDGEMKVYSTAGLQVLRLTPNYIQTGRMPIKYPYYRVDSFKSDGSGYFWAFGHEKSDGTQSIGMMLNDGVSGNKYTRIINTLQIASFASNEYNGAYPSFTTNVVLRNSGISYLNGGNVGIGVTSPQARLQTNLTITGSLLAYLNGTSATFDAQANIAVVHNSPSIGSATAAGLVLANNDKSDGAPSPIIAFSAKSASNSFNHTYAAIYGVRTATGADTNWTKGDLVFATGDGTGPKETMRITNKGFTKAKANGVNSFGGNYHEFVNNNNVSGDRAMVIGNAAGSATNNTSSIAFTVADNVNDRLKIFGNGNVVNLNNSYGASSDIKLKENIVDATSKLDDLMKVKIRNYNFIGDDKKQIGVVAQELEGIFPNMIDESIDYEYKKIEDKEGNITEENIDLGTTTKSVKYSVFVPMLIKAIQELKAEIEILKSK